MKTRDKDNKQIFLVAFVTMLATLLLSSGEWDLYDLIISILVIILGWSYLKEKEIFFDQKKEVAFVSTVFSLLILAVITVLISFVVKIFFSDCLREVCPNLKLFYLYGEREPVEIQPLYQVAVFLFFIYFLFYSKILFF